MLRRNNELHSGSDRSNNNRSLIVAPIFSGKSYLLLNILSEMIDRDSFIFTKSPLQHYSDFKIEMKEKRVEIKSLIKYKNDVIVFDDVLGSSDCKKKTDQLFIGEGIII